eukprot:TRINITY_DN2728_c0_g1_i1.p1 TRINITY_DN2728_c0_g1~~TRINITY_DN2728_c0_g1_i1.p1  ORF type:complete len:301 (+),score=44.61 TRINITY_DN2728_c0_g1_i1:250-1152(+)
MALPRCSLWPNFSRKRFFSLERLEFILDVRSVPKKIIAFGTHDNAIRFYNQQNVTIAFEIPGAHDDTVTGILVSPSANQVISYSKDCSLKLWSFTSSNFPKKVPIETIFDHDSKIRCADVYENILGTFDVDGKLTVRDLNTPQELISTTAISVTKNQHFCLCDASIMAVGNTTSVEIYQVDGTFVNMIDLEEKIVFMASHASYLVVVLENGKIMTIDWQTATIKAEADFGDAIAKEQIVCGHLCKTGEKLFFGTQSGAIIAIYQSCLLYTSDAADDTPCVDLGGRRIIKKKKIIKITEIK